MESAVRRLIPHREGRHNHLHAEQFKQWRQEVYPGEQSKTPPWIERWMCLVKIVQNMCHTGGIPRYLLWTVLVLLTKGTTNTRDIGLLEILWKVLEVLIDTHLHASLQLHDVLHGFRAGRGVGGL